MIKKSISIFLVFLMAVSLFAVPAAAKDSPGNPVVNDLVSATSSLSQFFGNAISFMKDAIGYLTGGIEATNHYQTGTDLINDMLVNGPPQPSTPEVAQASEISSDGNEITTPTVEPGNMDNAKFSSLLSNYRELAVEEKTITEQLDKNQDAGLRKIAQDIRKTKEANKNKILFALSQDIETKKFDKLHLLVDYINTQGDDTYKFFFEIVDETKMKLQVTLIQAQNLGVSVDIEIIEGKLELIFNLTSGK